MSSIVKSLRALSDPTRLRLLLLLMEEELTVAELQEILGMGQSRISASLSLLKREGLAIDRRVGKNIFYSVRREGLSELETVLAAVKRELTESAADQLALELVLRKRKDKAAEYFNRLAGKFGRTYIPGRSWQALAHALLRLMPPMVIADLGAGEGTLSQLLARTSKRVIAIDNSEKMVEFGAELAREHGFKNLEYRLGDIEDPPIADGDVDLALFSQALHHAASPQKAVHAAHRILKTGGKIVVLDLVSHGYEQARELYAHLWMGFSEAELHQMLKAAGFRNIEVSIVARETQTPNFQTVLATAVK
ncbi:MAG TPA: metalloregulator ArsR/SmtB family transcription factor [Terrimicrobiaceae bacterium]|nr:metalloregulator ArsR/SmtB family transcription factor [Terrimicrobiaceae bacterium]